jgi:hypothetical protein
MIVKNKYERMEMVMILRYYSGGFPGKAEECKEKPQLG